MTANEPEKDVARIDAAIRTRLTLGRDGASVELGVLCPYSGSDEPLDACFECPHFVAGRSRGGEAPAITCRLPREETDARAVDTPRGDCAKGDVVSVGDIMTSEVICVRSDLGVGALVALLLDKGISGAPVVDADGRPIGVVSKTDILRCIRADFMRAPALTVGDIMVPLAFCLPVNESIAKAAALMAFERVHRIPVVSASRRVVGILSSLDVLRWLAREHGYVVGGGGIRS